MPRKQHLKHLIKPIRNIAKTNSEYTDPKVVRIIMSILIQSPSNTNQFHRKSIRTLQVINMIMNLIARHSSNYWVRLAMSMIILQL